MHQLRNHQRLQLVNGRQFTPQAGFRKEAGLFLFLPPYSTSGRDAQAEPHGSFGRRATFSYIGRILG